MKKLGLAAIAGLVLVISISFFSHSTKEENHPVNALEVGKLVSGDYVITIFTEADRNLYSVANHDGKTLGELLDDRALESEFPRLHEQLKTGIAGIWAGMDLVDPALPIGIR